MIVGVDVRVPTKNKTGIAYLIDNIVPELVKRDRQNQYKVFGRGLHIQSDNLKSYFFPKIFQRGLNLLWRIIHFPPTNIFLGKTDQFIFFNFVDFPVITRRRILMIPDTSFIKFPRFTERKNLRFLKKGVGDSIKRADVVLTISENAKNEICEYYNIARERVEVVYPGCPINIATVEDVGEIAEAKDRYGIGNGGYILFFGTIEPRKNIGNLIEAYSRLSGLLKGRYRLVLAGGKGWESSKIFDIIRERGLADKVVFTGYVDEKDRSAIYSGASLFVLPSFYEGFGLPILEAFACEVPVACSNASSLPEVGGDAVLYFDPNEVDEISKSIETGLTDAGLRADLINKGSQQLKKFSWDKAVEKILHILVS